MNILITSAGRRVSLVRAFKKEIVKIIPDGKIFTTDLNPELSAACHVADGYFRVPRVTDTDYCHALLGICLQNKIKLIIPTIDTELIPLAENADLFIKNGITPVISTIDIIRICRDKRKLFGFFDSLEFPRTMEIDFDKPEFPIFVKPYDGSSSVGIKIVYTSSQLEQNSFRDDKLIFLKYLDPKDYTEYTIDLYFDKNSKLKCAVPRERIEVRTGEVSKSITRRDTLYETICSIFEYCRGFAGCITLQVFRNNITHLILGIEINPRFGGGYPLSYFAGANYPEFIIREYILNQNIDFFDKWEANMLMIRYDDEILIHDFKG
jgi:carbamoyl-phosphate synthase large subunit